jgi:hypothetical protein
MRARTVALLIILFAAGAAYAVQPGGAGIQVETFPGLETSKSITVESPTAAEDLTFFFTNKAITVTEMRAVFIGADTPSLTWTVRHHATDRENAGIEVVTGGTATTSTTAGSDVTAFDDATIPADSFVWIETTADNGTLTEFAMTVFFTVD